MKYTKTYTLAVILAILQILDGILTYIGVSSFGVIAEGNPLIAFFIDIIGPAPALFLLKFASLFVIYILCSRCFKVDELGWLNCVLFLLVILYSGAAVGPWLFVLSKF